MNNNKQLFLSVFFPVVCTLLVACSGNIIDRLPKHVAKGYVEFYLADRRYMHKEKITIKQIDQKDAEKKVAALASHTGLYKVAISARPGTQTFVVKREDEEELITLTVHEAMVTPVRIEIKESSRKFVEKIKTRKKENKLKVTYVNYADINLEAEQPFSEKMLTTKH